MYLNCENKQEFNSFNVYHGDTIDGHWQTTNHCNMTLTKGDFSPPFIEILQKYY